MGPTPDEKRRRKRGVCWSCSSRRPVRPRTFWITGTRKPLCCVCEKQFDLCTGAR